MKNKSILILAVLMMLTASSLIIMDSDESDADTYTVYFTAGTGGTVSIPSKSVSNAYTEFSCTATPNTNYTFSGWYSNGTLATTMNPIEGTVVDYNGITFEARFTYTPPPTYTVYFTAGTGGSVSISSKSVSNTYSEFSCTATPNTNYTFSGWYVNNSYYSSSNPITGVVFDHDGTTFQARFTYNPPAPTTYTCYLYYNANGGSGAPSTQSYTSTSTSNHTFTISNTIPTWSGYTFLGWSESSSASTSSYSPGGSISVSYNGSKTLYAVWDDSHTYSLTYNMNGGTPQISTQTWTGTGSSHTFTISSTVPTKSGYVFAGWDTQYTATNPQYQPGDSINVSAFADDYSVPLYAVWQQLQTFSLTYNMNGGTPQIATQTYQGIESSHTFTISSTVPTKSGYVFLGWDTRYDADTVQYNPGDSITVSAVADDYSVPLYAVWEKFVVFWSNDLYNGSVSIAFKYSGSGGMTHEMNIPLYSATIDDQQRATWTQNGYNLKINISHTSSTSIEATLTGGITPITATKSLGNWMAFILTISPSTGNITFTPIDRFTDFTSYTTMDSQSVNILSWETEENTTLYEIEHSDTGTGNPVRLSVVETMTFLDTFGVVLTDPSINVFEYFPQYNSVQLNLYAFAVYGQTMTINGNTWEITSGTITITYTEETDGTYVIASSGSEGAQSRVFTLSNISITWTGTECILTFNDDAWSVSLGTYSTGSETISFTGLWYFTASLYEPYTATKTVVSGGWDSLMNIDSSALLLVFLGIVLITGLACHIKLGLKWLDISMLVIAMIVAFTLLG